MQSGFPLPFDFSHGLYSAIDFGKLKQRKLDLHNYSDLASYDANPIWSSIQTNYNIEISVDFSFLEKMHLNILKSFLDVCGKKAGIHLKGLQTPFSGKWVKSSFALTREIFKGFFFT